MQAVSEGAFRMATKQWENARDSLSIALRGYLDSCISLENGFEYGYNSAKDLASRIDSTLESLQHEMSLQLIQSTATLARIRNRAASPIWSLPEEILSQIFLNVVYSPGTRSLLMGACLQKMYHNLHNLIAVCSVWRMVALTRGQLWEAVPASDDPIKYQAMDLSIERSRGRALCFATTLPKDGIPPLLIEAVTAHAPRFRALNLKGMELNKIRNIIAAVLKADTLSQLSELSIHCTSVKTKGICVVRPDSPEQDAFNALINSLSVLRLAGTQIHWETATLSNRLVEFFIHKVELGNSDSAIYTFLSALSSANELRNLKIMFVRAYRGSNEIESLARSIPQVVFPKLQSLVLFDLCFNVLEYFLLAIAPGSYHLSLGIMPETFQVLLRDHWKPKQMNPEDLATRLSLVSIDTLTLSRGPLNTVDPWLEGSGLRKLLESTPRLKKLYMHGWEFDADFCNGLSCSDWIFPRLEVLQIEQARVSSEVGFKSIIANSMARTMVLGGYIREGDESWTELKG
ncbi:hypothetical protein FRC11_004974, partial [Ceratobasidium sp. 423]